MNPIFKLDESGEFVTGYFYCLHSSSFADWGPELGQNRDWIVSVSDLEDRFVRAEEVGCKTKEIRECPLNPSHVTLKYCEKIDLDLYGGDSVGPFVPEFAETLVSEDLARRLENSGLPKVHTIAAAIAENQSACRNPRIWLLQFRGRSATRWYRIYPESANRCPFCADGPIICPGCGHREVLCAKCGEDWSRLEKEKPAGAHDSRIPIRPSPLLGPIIEPNRWDGSDFMPYSVVTRRVLDFLLSVHAAPFRAQPLRVDMRGITDEKRALLEKAKEPVGVGSKN